MTCVCSLLKPCCRTAVAYGVAFKRTLRLKPEVFLCNNLPRESGARPKPSPALPPRTFASLPMNSRRHSRPPPAWVSRFYLESHHDELSAFKPQTRTPRRGEAEKGICSVPHGEHGLVRESYQRHGMRRGTLRHTSVSTRWIYSIGAPCSAILNSNAYGSRAPRIIAEGMATARTTSWPNMIRNSRDTEYLSLWPTDAPLTSHAVLIGTPPLRGTRERQGGECRGKTRKLSTDCAHRCSAYC